MTDAEAGTDESAAAGGKGADGEEMWWFEPLTGEQRAAGPGPEDAADGDASEPDAGDRDVVGNTALGLVLRRRSRRR